MKMKASVGTLEFCSPDVISGKAWESGNDAAGLYPGTEKRLAPGRFSAPSFTSVMFAPQTFGKVPIFTGWLKFNVVPDVWK